jgi:carbamoyl-phosphate synthase/aspartate carbamoyltransferase
MPECVESLHARIPARLVLDDGTHFEGFSMGAPQGTSGEVVFTTTMTGYPETLTDPSYCDQILLFTYPLLGNYGVPALSYDEFGLIESFESPKIHARGMIVSDYATEAFHWTAHQNLSDWLQAQGTTAIYGVDTRALTKHIRSRGSCLGKIEVNGQEIPEFYNPNLVNLVAQVATREVKTYPVHPEAQNPPHVVVVDCGIKCNILRYLIKVLKFKITVVPWDFDFNTLECDGLFLSNGPGDPTHCGVTIEHLRTFMRHPVVKPIFGVCLGNQLLGLAAGAKTFKMRFGNRGANQPAIDLRDSRCYVTPQNHGYALCEDSLPTDWTPLFVNANDGSNEGISHVRKPWYSVQFHPEACGGPTDTSFLFDYFLDVLKNPAALSITTTTYSLPKRRNKVLILGSGGLRIGQAGEFDYSGSQAIKALKESNIYTILINPNVASIQTGSNFADRVFFLPITPEFVKEVILKEKPDGILCQFGGQTALNCAVELWRAGVFEECGVEVLGTPIETIIKTEDRDLFAQVVKECGYKTAESSCAATVAEGLQVAADIGYPVLIRAAFALGGLGSGFAANPEEAEQLLKTAFGTTHQVIIDKSLRGWREVEYEVVRDAKNNCVTVCNMENLDPMGIHTGDSIVVAPSQTLTNAEYFALRECAIKMIRHLGVVGECNIQYSIDPHSSEFRIIEVNARLSRSSALASKATGYPLAYVAAKLALDHDLVSLRNSITKVTTACFEPALDYCVVKIPRWDLKKFDTVCQTLGPCMKSVGEVMAIGRNFEEAIQKALRMVDESCVGFEAARFDLESEMSNRPIDLLTELTTPTPLRMWALAKAFALGYSVSELGKLTSINPWFLHKLERVANFAKALTGISLKQLEADPVLHKELKCMGFADAQVAHLLQNDENGRGVSEDLVRRCRLAANIRPFVKQIDTLAAEFPAQTNYLYLTYNGCEHDVLPTLQEARPINEASASNLYHYGFGSAGDLKDTADIKPAIMVLGCGSYRIGSSVEFDWCSVSAVRAFRSLGYTTIMINCNPETVSTDFDESDRLYFENLSTEVIAGINEFECPRGLVISVGGQTANNLAVKLQDVGCQILGTSVESIDTAENRFKFSNLCDQLRIDQPAWSEFTTFEEALTFCQRVGFPTLVRPSYVLSGAAMRVVYDQSELEEFLENAAVVSPDYPVVISKYIGGAKEIEFDAVANQGELLNYAISEHIENAGVHSGDASLLLPAQKLYIETHRRIKRICQKLARALNVSGPFNIQFMCKSNDVKVIEMNLRASRTFPFIAKTFNVNFIELASKVILNLPVKPAALHPMEMSFVSCKIPIFSFKSLDNSDPRLGVEMQSTGEVAAYGANLFQAYLTAWLAAGNKLPSTEKRVFVSIGPKKEKEEFLPFLIMLRDMGFKFYCTSKTTSYFQKNVSDLDIITVYKPCENLSPNFEDLFSGRQIELVINIPDSSNSFGKTAGFKLRRLATTHANGLFMDIKCTELFVRSLQNKYDREQMGKPFWTIASWQEFHGICKP